MNIGIIKEIQSGEDRIALVPEAAAELAAAGATVAMEKGAGDGAGFPDAAFTRAGVRVLPTAAAVLEGADLVVKVKGPTAAEFDAFRDGQALFCFLVPQNRPELVAFLLSRRLTALAFEAVRTDAGRFPMLEPMSTIAGQQAVFIGQNLLSGRRGGPGISLVRYPGLAPARVAVLGGGTAGTAAARTAAALGAAVDLFEIDADRLRWLEGVLPANAVCHHVHDGRLADTVAEADLVINTATVPARSPLHLIDRATVGRMRPGRVIVDVSATVGGAVETVDRLTTHADPVYTVDGIVHYAVPNIPGIVARTASTALSINLLPYVMRLAVHGLPVALDRCADLRRALVCIDGQKIR